jgi:hypothetical protein
MENLIPENTLPRVLEAGTWALGRIMAAKLRPETKGPPIEIISDGTVFWSVYTDNSLLFKTIVRNRIFEDKKNQIGSWQNKAAPANIHYILEVDVCKLIPMMKLELLPLVFKVP